jgi:2-iminobutanoate/2-iminopropanoate deaminase
MNDAQLEGRWRLMTAFAYPCFDPDLSCKPERMQTNAPQTYDAGFSHQIGRYSDAIRVPADYDQIVVSGTPGLDENGNIPADFADEARQAWRNVAAILDKAEASISDIVSIRQYLTREEDIKTYVAVQQEILTHEPAGMLLVPTARVWARDPRRSRSRSTRPIMPLTVRTD